MGHKTELAIALDFPTRAQADDCIKRIGPIDAMYKIGLELFSATGPEFVRELRHQGKRVFLDLKFHDIPNTVAKAARQAAFLQVEMFTLHLAGGSHMIRATAQELAEIPALKPKILGVSVLTSFDDVKWAEVTRAVCGHAANPVDSVDGLVGQAHGWGADGVVCSAHELKAIRKNYPGLYTVVPGIRPEGSAVNDQARVMTPGEARALGAHLIVVGRPITEAANPKDAAKNILKELGH